MQKKLWQNCKTFSFFMEYLLLHSTPTIPSFQIRLFLLELQQKQACFILGPLTNNKHIQASVGDIFAEEEKKTRRKKGKKSPYLKQLRCSPLPYCGCFQSSETNLPRARNIRHQQNTTLFGKTVIHSSEHCTPCKIGKFHRISRWRL